MNVIDASQPWSALYHRINNPWRRTLSARVVRWAKGVGITHTLRGAFFDVVMQDGTERSIPFEFRDGYVRVSDVRAAERRALEVAR